MGTYIKLFKDVNEANVVGAEGLLSPHVDIVNGKSVVNFVNTNTESFTASFDNNGKIIDITPVSSGQPNNEIWYTSSDGNIVTPGSTGVSVFGANIVSNTYNDGKGVITFDSAVTMIGEWAFFCCLLKGITMPDSITSIGGGAFWNCTSLSSVICNSTTPPSLGKDAFSGNASGRKIYVPSASVDTYKAAANWSTYANDIVAQS